LPPDSIARLADYLLLLRKWNRVHNLTAIRDPLKMVGAHVMDSLSIHPWVTGKRAVDVGSGAGLPGIPLSLIEPDRHWTLLEPNAKKAGFLTHAVMELSLENVSVVQSRAEDVGPGINFDCVVCRALGPLQRILPQVRTLLAPGAKILAMKGRIPKDELDCLPEGFMIAATHTLRVPQLDAERHLLEISGTDRS